jgi:hypothetical protein
MVSSSWSMTEPLPECGENRLPCSRPWIIGYRCDGLYRVETYGFAGAVTTKGKHKVGKRQSPATEAPNALGSASNNLMVENTDFEAAAPPRKRVRFATISEREVRSCGI